MPDDVSTSWTVSVSRDTDLAVRTSLARRGMDQGDFSKFIEDAVRWRLLDETIAEARAGFDELSPDEIEELVEQAVRAVRQAPRADEG